jgi:hypothetical protein
VTPTHRRGSRPMNWLWLASADSAAWPRRRT